MRIKNRVPLNVTKIELDAMLLLLNMIMESSNLRKKNIREPLYVTEQLSNLILKLYNVIMEPSSLKNK